MPNKTHFNAPILGNQKNKMSDDPGDGARGERVPHIEGGGPPGEAPDEQNADALAEFGRRGSKQE